MANTLLLRPPNPPDFSTCDSSFGQGLIHADCLTAATFLQQGTDRIPYLLDNPSSPYFLPFSVHHGSCQITVERAGPADATVLSLIPDQIRELAGYITQECVVNSGGIGGFITLGMYNVVNYILRPHTDLNAPYPDYTTFITVTLTRPEWSLRSSGNYDPSIALLFSYYAYLQAQIFPRNTDLGRLYDQIVQLWNAKAVCMNRGGTSTPWWYFEGSQTPNQMTYECDTGLGSPTPLDCTDIEWNQLRPASETLEVGPNNVTFLTRNTCYLAISASIATVLTWEQIRMAVAALMSICVQHPLQPSQGGRAHFDAQGQISGRLRKRQNGITGLNALPPNTNITIFKQTEPWTSSVDELNSCTWRAVSKGESASTCGTP